MSQSVHLRKYGVQTTIDFEVYEVDGVDLRTDWTPASSDCEVMKDEGASTECSNTVVDEGSTYSIVLSATEMQAARLVVKVVDAATKVFLDKIIIIETYGNASAMHAFDLGTAMHATVTTIASDLIVTDAVADKVSSDLIVADTVIDTIASDLIVADAIVDKAYSDTTIIASDLIVTDAVVDKTYSDTTIIASDLIVLDTVADTVASDLIVADAVVDKVYSDTMVIASDLIVTDAVADTVASDLLIMKTTTDNMAPAATTLITGTVSHDNTVATTTVFYSDDIAEATADHYNGRLIAFTSGALLGQYTDITDYALVSGEGKFTITATTEAPADNSTFEIV